MLPNSTFENSSVLFSSGEFQVELCITPEQLEAALAARARFYETVEDLSVSPHGDEFDFQANAKVFVVKREKEILGTIRNIAYNQAYDWRSCVTTHYWPEVVKVLGGERIPLLESSRFAIQVGLNRYESLKIQGMLFRVHSLAYEVESHAYFTTFVRPKHSRFYEKFIGMTAVAEDKVVFGTLTRPLAVVPPAECTFPYSLPEILGIDMDTCIARYQVLKERHLASFSAT